MWLLLQRTYVPSGQRNEGLSLAAGGHGHFGGLCSDLVSCRCTDGAIPNVFGAALYLEETMKYHAKGTLSILVILLLSAAIVLFAAQLSAQDLPVEPQTGFEIEGNTAWDGHGDFDWENVEDKGAVRFLDPHSKADVDPTTFKPDGKFDKPEEWSIVPGNVGPSQNELTNTTVWAVRPGELDDDRPDDFWLIMGMERTKKEGTFFLDFEYNQ
ncbi:MAG: hypothetical protein JSW55_10375, partial [Chloroflexota bacterium]